MTVVVPMMDNVFYFYAKSVHERTIPLSRSAEHPVPNILLLMNCRLCLSAQAEKQMQAEQKATAQADKAQLAQALHNAETQVEQLKQEVMRELEGQREVGFLSGTSFCSWIHALSRVQACTRASHHALTHTSVHSRA